MSVESRPLRIAATVTLVCAGLLPASCGGNGGEEAPRATVTQPPASQDRGQEPRKPVRAKGEPRVETVATGLNVPWEIAFLPDGSALVTERPTGKVLRVSRDGKLQPSPVGRVDVGPSGEGGLLGLAVDPDFRRNRFVYLYRTIDAGGGPENEGDRLRDEEVLVSGIKGAPIHDGGRLRFGPDDRLYISTGDAGSPELAQDEGTLNGKLLRLSPRAYRGNGGRPQVFSFGHRNPQGFDWDPRTGELVEDEHGDVGNDEINVLRRGRNYGWPTIQGDQRKAGLVSPVTFYPESIAPSGATFLRSGDSQWTGDYLIATLVGEHLRRVRLEKIGGDGARVAEQEALFKGRFGRLRTVVEAPDGTLYVLTSNRDGRGSPSEQDDRILRVVPPAR
jgi:glucose/arabinose dehydrogenase